MKFKIQVTKEDIERGTRGKPTSCPIAQACKRQGFHSVSIASMILFTCPDTSKQYVFCTPQAAQRFINRFDAGLDVDPFTFELEETT